MQKDITSSASKAIDYKNPEQSKITQFLNTIKKPRVDIPDISIPDFGSDLAPEIRDAVSKIDLPPLPKLSELLKDADTD